MVFSTICVLSLFPLQCDQCSYADAIDSVFFYIFFFSFRIQQNSKIKQIQQPFNEANSFIAIFLIGLVDVCVFELYLMCECCMEFVNRKTENLMTVAQLVHRLERMHA